MGYPHVSRTTTRSQGKECEELRIKPLLPAGALLALLSVVLLLGTADTAHAGTFNPTVSGCLDDAATEDPDPFIEGHPGECDGDNTPEVNSDFTTLLNIGGPNCAPSESPPKFECDVNFAGLVTFLPSDWGLVPGDEIPIGAIVGKLTSRVTLGLINAPCSDELVVAFTFLNSSIDPSDTVPFPDTDDDLIEEFVEDEDQSGLPDGFEKYPEFITRVLVDENDQPLQPIRRSAAITVVAGTNVLLQSLIFEPGTFINENIPNDEELGYPSVTLLQNIGDPDAEPVPGVITDFCTPLLSSNITFGVSKDNPCTDDVPLDELDPLCAVRGAPFDIPDEGATVPDEGGVVLFVNPQDGTYEFTTISAGQRDADGDGLENSLDTCPFVANVGSPRIGDGDKDEDGLDAACDPDDNRVNSDEDLDGYLNRQDNCPLVANGENEADIPGVGNQDDSDKNEQGDDALDQIGDACDPNPDSPDGDLIIVQTAFEIAIGTGEGEGGPPSTDACPNCFRIGDTDAVGTDDYGGGSSTLIIIIVIVIAAVVVVGGGAFLLTRRGGGGSTPA